MPTTNLPADKQELSELYQKTIDIHHGYLERLHAAFNARCEKIGAETKEKLAAIDKDDKESREKILMEEKELLDKTLAELKRAINKSNADARKKLEEIQERLEDGEMNLEQELSSL